MDDDAGGAKPACCIPTWIFMTECFFLGRSVSGIPDIKFRFDSRPEQAWEGLNWRKYYLK